MSAGRTRALLLAALALAGAAVPAGATPPEPPLSVSLKLLSADAARGRYRVEVRLRARVALEDAVLVLKVLPREESARAARAGRAGERETREDVVLRPGRELRREVDVLTGAQEPVTLLVGAGGRLDGARVHRTRGLDLGPEAEAAPGRVRVDQHGRAYYDVPMGEPR